MLTILENSNTVEEKWVTQRRNRDSVDNATGSEIEDRGWRASNSTAGRHSENN